MREFLIVMLNVILVSSLSVAQESEHSDIERTTQTRRGRAPSAEPSVNGGYLNRPFAIEVQGAPLGGPLGILGAAANYAPIPNLSLEAGLGAGGFAPQWGVAVRPKLLIGEGIALEFSAGYSHGDYKPMTFDVTGLDGAFLFNDCSWINADIGFEWRSPWHILFRPFFGVSKLVSSSTPVWHENGHIVTPEPSYAQSHREPRYPTLPYLGLAVGYYFWI